MPHGAGSPFFLLFAIYFALIAFAIVRNFRRFLGKSMKRKMGTDGQPYFFSKRKYGKHGMKYIVSAGVPVQNGFVFSICRRTFWHRFLTPLGLAQDMKTGDAQLDDVFYFMADDDERLKLLLTSQGFVSSLREAFEANQAKDIECTRDRLWFNTKPVNVGGNVQLTALFKAGTQQADTDEQAFAAQAARLAQAVEKLEAPDYQRNSGARPLSSMVFIYRIIHAAFLLLAIVMAATLLFRNEDIINAKDFFIEAASVSLVVVLLWLMLLLALFGRTSWFPRVCGSFVLSGLAGLVVLTGFVIREADIDFDHAQPDTKILALQSKECALYCTTGGKHARTSNYPLRDRQCAAQQVNDTLQEYREQDYICRHSAQINYTLNFPWPTERADGDAGPYKLKARAESYEQAYSGQSFAFPIHGGYLGLPWIRKSEIRAE